MKLLVEAASDQQRSGQTEVPLSRVLMQQLVQSGREDATSVWCQRVCEAINAKVRSVTGFED